LKLLILVELKL